MDETLEDLKPVLKFAYMIGCATLADALGNMGLSEEVLQKIEEVQKANFDNNWIDIKEVLLDKLDESEENF